MVGRRKSLEKGTETGYSLATTKTLLVNEPAYPLWQNPKHLVAPTPRLLIHTPLFQECISLYFGVKWSIGRDKTNTIILPDQLASRQHAILQYMPSGNFTLTDVGSANGSFINGKRVTKPTVLVDGARLIVGNTEIDFQCPSQPYYKSDINLKPRMVFMIQSSKIQGEIWREILSSQGISVIWAPARVDIEKLLDQIRELGLALPDLLLLDIGTQNQNPYDFCRWCRINFPEIKIILTSGMRTEIYKSERTWAKHNGAVDLLPGFRKPNIFAQASEVSERLRIILESLKWQPLTDNALAATLLALHEDVHPG